mgnify:CR=1 FL=1
MSIWYNATSSKGGCFPLDLEAPAPVCLCAPVPVLTLWFPEMFFCCIGKATRDAYCDSDLGLEWTSIALAPCYFFMWIVFIFLGIFGFFVGFFADLFVWIGWLISCGCCLKCCPWQRHRQWGYCKQVECDCD